MGKVLKNLQDIAIAITVPTIFGEEETSFGLRGQIKLIQMKAAFVKCELQINNGFSFNLSISPVMHGISCWFPRLP